MPMLNNGVLDFSRFHNIPVNDHIGYSCIECGKFYEFDEYAAMRCCGNDTYYCRYKRLSDNEIFDL